MPDIELRFQRDMLVLSSPIDVTLARQGVDASLDLQYLNLMEPDVVQDALKLEVVAGAHCLVATTEDITRARLAHVRMDGDAAKLAASALGIARSLKPQHLIVEIGPCGLPLDPSSKASLNENRSQYADAVRLFADGEVDAFLLSGFTDMADLKCALMGAAQVTGKPVFASVSIGAGSPGPAGVADAKRGDRDEDVLGGLRELAPLGGYSVLGDSAAPPAPAARRKLMDSGIWPEAVDVMADLGAAVVGFETPDPLDAAMDYAKTAAMRTDAPVLAQLRVAVPDKRRPAARGLVPLEDIREYTPDTLERAAVGLYGAGAQFLRATGHATPACTGALAATVQGLDVHRG